MIRIDEDRLRQDLEAPVRQGSAALPLLRIIQEFVTPRGYWPDASICRAIAGGLVEYKGTPHRSRLNQLAVAAEDGVDLEIPHDRTVRRRLAKPSPPSEVEGIPITYDRHE